MNRCARCGETGQRTGASWPEGRICRRCFQQATRLHGTCPVCHDQRLLPGLIDGNPACTDCAGIRQDFRCTRCCREDEPARKGLCAHCALAEDLATLLDDGTGTIAAPLMPLFTALTTQKHARSARTWLVRNPAAAQLLTGIAQGTKPLDHTSFTNHPSARKVAFLRELFVEHGLIEPFNKDIETYQDWLEDKLTDARTGIATMIRLYGRWAHLNRMHRLARTHQSRKGTLLSAKQSTTVAIEFLEFLASRNINPGACRQQDIDDWLASGPTTRALARSFVRWAIEHHHLPNVDFPYRTARTTRIISQEHRIDLIRRTVNGELPLTPADRCAAILLLVFGQPLTRIARLHRNQLTVSGGIVQLNLNEEQLTIPAPLDSIFADHLDELPHQNTSSHTRETWLFPGLRPGQHVHQTTLMNRLRRSGIDLLGAKNAALRALVLEIPAPLVAEALNYSYQATEKHRRNSGATFIDYVTTRSNQPAQ